MEHTTLCARTESGTGATGSGGRVVYRRRGAGARLSRPLWFDGRALPPRRSGNSHVSNRRLGALAFGRRSGVPGAHGFPGQASRLPHRLGEIEAVLKRHPDVGQAVVVVRDSRSGDKCLVAYLTLATGHNIDSAAVRRYVAERLPDYMTPAAIVLLDSLPLSPNGRNPLPAPEFTPATEWQAPRSPQGEILCSLFAKTLGLSLTWVSTITFRTGRPFLACDTPDQPDPHHTRN